MAALEQARGAVARPTPDEQALVLLEDWHVLTAPERRTRLSAVIHHVVVHNDLPNIVVDVHTTWGSVMPYSGVPRPADDLLKQLIAGGYVYTDPDAPPASTDPQQLLTPAEAARVVETTPQTLRQWFLAGWLPHTQTAADGRSRLYAVQDLRKIRPRHRPTGGVGGL